MVRSSMRMMGLGIVLAFLSGCAVALIGAGVGAGVASYSYVKGELQREYPAPLNRTWTATVRALNALEVRVVNSKKDQLGGKIEARRGDGTKVKVALEAEARDRTLVRIRIGTFGDRDASERIGKEIETRL